VPKVVACVEEDLEELLTFLDCPKTHWRKVRTTNAIERAWTAPGKVEAPSCERMER
jgi:transposase-like protein